MDAGDVVLVYITIGSREKAAELARNLVESCLVACVNVLGDVTSYYRWDGKLCEDGEVALIAKTSFGRLEDLVRRVKEVHDYEVPAIVAIPAIGGNPDFLAWVGESMRAGAG